MTTHVAYDTRSGRIISIHHGEKDASQIHQRAQRHGKIEQGHIGVISVLAETMQRGKRYKVDTGRKALVEAAAGEGIGFGFGATGKMGGAR
jgi:hypothetical protein